jgi:hypothetical protein
LFLDLVLLALGARSQFLQIEIRQAFPTCESVWATAQSQLAGDPYRQLVIAPNLAGTRWRGSQLEIVKDRDRRENPSDFASAQAVLR